MPQAGFIGLGHMGLPMACNLLKNGYQVTGYDLQPEALAVLSAAGGIAANSLAEAAQDKDIIITMLQTGDQVKTVCLEKEGLFSIATAGTLYIDCSSIAVKDARTLHEQATVCGLLSLDAPVSGGVAGATAGTLTFMVGGEESVFEEAKPLLQTLGKTIIYAGSAGSGQAAKICNNMILGISMAAISEAFCLADTLGLERKKLFEIVNNASGQCWAMSKYVPVPGLLEQVPANHDYQPGFTARMMLKDLRLSQDAATEGQLATTVAAAATNLYQDFVNQGVGDLDFSAIIKKIAGNY